MYCSNCGHELQDNSTFCPFCGVQIEKIKNNNNIKEDISRKKQHSKSSKVMYYIIAIAVVIVISIIVVVVSKKVEENRKEQVKQVLYDFAEAYNSGDMLKLQEIMPYKHMYIEQTELENLISKYEEELKYNYPLELLVKEITRMKKANIELLESGIGRLLLGSFLIEDISRGYMVEVSMKLDEDILKENITFEVIKVNGAWYVNPVAMEDLSAVQEEYLDNKIKNTIEMYSGFVGNDANKQKLNDIINDFSKENYNLVNSSNNTGSYSVKDIDGDKVPEFLLGVEEYKDNKFTYCIYIIDNKLQITQIVLDGIPSFYNVPETDYICYVDNLGVKMIYNAKMRGEELVSSNGVYKEEVVARVVYDEGASYYDAQNNIISEEKVYSYLGAFTENCDSFHYSDFHYLTDERPLKEWKN